MLDSRRCTLIIKSERLVLLTVMGRSTVAGAGNTTSAAAQLRLGFSLRVDSRSGSAILTPNQDDTVYKKLYSVLDD